MKFVTKENSKKPISDMLTYLNLEENSEESEHIAELSLDNLIDLVEVLQEIRESA